MKKFYLFIIVIVMAIWSCGGSQSDKAEKDNTEEKKASTEDVTKDVTEETGDTKSEKFKSCDEFLDAYEKWIDAYLEVLEKYMKNPMDPVVSKDYIKSAREMQEWAVEWTNIYTCSMQKKYQKRFEEIAAKADKKIEEIGLK